MPGNELRKLESKHRVYNEMIDPRSGSASHCDVLHLRHSFLGSKGSYSLVDESITPCNLVD